MKQHQKGKKSVPVQVALAGTGFNICLLFPAQALIYFSVITPLKG